MQHWSPDRQKVLIKNHYHNSPILVIRIWLEPHKSLGDRWNCLDDDVIMAGPKPLPKHFGVQPRLERFVPSKSIGKLFSKFYSI